MQAQKRIEMVFITIRDNQKEVIIGSSVELSLQSHPASSRCRTNELVKRIDTNGATHSQRYCSGIGWVLLLVLRQVVGCIDLTNVG